MSDFTQLLVASSVMMFVVLIGGIIVLTVCLLMLAKVACMFALSKKIIPPFSSFCSK